MKKNDKEMFKTPAIVSTIMKYSLTGTVEMINNIKKNNSNEKKENAKKEQRKCLKHY